MKEYKRLFPYLKRYVWWYVFGLFFLVITDGGQLFMPQIIKSAIDIISGGRFELSAVLQRAIMLAGVALAVAVGRFGWRFFLNGTSRRIEAELRDDLFRHLLTLSSSFYNRTKTGDLMARATNDMRAIRMATGMAFVAFIDGLFMAAAIFTILFTQYTELALITIIPLPVIAILTLGMGKLIGERFRRVQEGFSRLSEHVQETLSGIRVVKSFVQEKHVIGRFHAANMEYVGANMALVKIWGFFFPLIMFLSGVSALLLLRFGGVAVIERKLTPGDFVAVLAYLQMLRWPMAGIGFTVNMIQRGAASLGRINRILEEKPDITSPPSPRTEVPAGDLVVQDLSYGYEDGDPILKEINFVVPEGSTLGILGRTGSGKSTLVKLIPRLLDPPRGTITIAGRDVHEWDLHVLRSSIAMVPQDTFLFSAPIKENIAFGDPSLPEETLSAAAEVSTINRDLENFPSAWDTTVGERGITLSGGQKQRVAISRAVAVNPQFMIFDDALASVDTETEERILSRFLKLRAGRSNILISHRVSTLQAADRIIVLDNGRIVQSGTHEELLEEEGFYREVYTIQQMEGNG